MATDTIEAFIERFKAEHLTPCHAAYEKGNSLGCFQIDEWRCQQDPSIERIKYYSPDPNRLLREIEYEGWRRHIPARRLEEGPRFIFHIRPGANSLKIQADLARLVDDPAFREIGCWLEPISMDFEDPILAVNFSENSIENNSEYVDELFSRISNVEKIPETIIVNLKNVIAQSCVDRFKDKVIAQGFSEGFKNAIQLLRPCALKGVSTPYQVAALFCQENEQNEAAIILIRNIHKTHWQYEEARTLERSIYHSQIETLLSEIASLKREKMKLQEELFKTMHGNIELAAPVVEDESLSKNSKETKENIEPAAAMDPETESAKSNEIQLNSDTQCFEEQTSTSPVSLPLPEEAPKTRWHLHITEYHRPNAPPIMFTKLEKFRQLKLSEILLNMTPTKPKTP